MYLQLNENNQTEFHPNGSVVVYEIDNKTNENRRKDMTNNKEQIDKDQLEGNSNDSGAMFNVNMIFKHIDDRNQLNFKHKIAILNQVIEY